MSKVLQCLTGKVDVGVATKVLAAAGVTLKPVAVAAPASEVNGAVSGGFAVAGALSREEFTELNNKLEQPVHSRVLKVQQTAAVNPDTTYDDASFTFVKAVSDASTPVPASDRVDKFKKLGIPVADDIEKLNAGFDETAALAVAAATQAQTRITVFQKPQTAYKELNTLFHQAIRKAADAAGVSVEVQTSQHVANAAIMFSKTLGVVVSPDYTAADNFAGVVTGIAGGRGMASEEYVTKSATIHAAAQADGSASSENPTGLLFASVSALKGMGHSAEAQKLEAALQKAYKGSTLPKDVLGGSATASAFGDAVISSM